MNFLSKEGNRRTFFYLWIFCILGSWAVLPYIQNLHMLPETTSYGRLFLFTTMQSALFYGLICWLSFKILPKTDLHPFIFKDTLKRIVYPAILSGIFIGFTIFFVERNVFHASVLSEMPSPPLWTRALASIYGAVNEEVLLRLFLFTLLYFLLCKCFKPKQQKKTRYLWMVNITVALLFGLGHLPATFKLIPPSAFEISRVLVLNGIAGIVLGWLYWSRGLWTAMAAHFVADLMMHVILT